MNILLHIYLSLIIFKFVFVYKWCFSNYGAARYACKSKLVYTSSVFMQHHTMKTTYIQFSFLQRSCVHASYYALYLFVLCPILYSCSVEEKKDIAYHYPENQGSVFL